jgi:hypothetical protein
MLHTNQGETLDLGLMGVKQLFALNLVTAASILLIWYLTHKAENAKWKQQREDEKTEREADRTEREKASKADQYERERQAVEHMEKWRSMLVQHHDETDRLIKHHAAENDRAYRLLDRQTQVNELHASLLQLITAKMDQRSYCPINHNQKELH